MVRAQGRCLQRILFSPEDNTIVNIFNFLNAVQPEMVQTHKIFMEIQKVPGYKLGE